MKTLRLKIISVPETLEIKVFEAVKIDDKIAEGFVQLRKEYPSVLDLPNRRTSFGEYLVKGQDFVVVNRLPRAPSFEMFGIGIFEAIF